jgi:hypothetical protein
MQKTIATLSTCAMLWVSVYSANMDRSKQCDAISSISIPGLAHRGSWVFWPETMDKDSLARSLQSAVVQFRQSKKENFSDQIVEGICWHLLYRIGLDSGLTLTNRILSTLSASYPGRPETAWLNGVNCIWSGRLKKGFSILDSLRTNVYQNDTAFSKEYLRIAQRCFLPINDPKDDLAGSCRLVQKRYNTYIGPDDIIPSQIKWSIHESMGKNFTLTGFSLSAIFNLVPSPLLQFPPLTQTRNLLLNVVIDTQIVAHIPTPLVSDPFFNKVKMEMKISATLGTQSSSLADFLYPFVCNQFDEIKTTSDLIKFKAIAVRCRKRSCFQNVEGDYYSYVTFDAQVSSGHGQIRIEPTTKLYKKGSIGVRYLIAMRSSESVENKAEQILQNVLAKFDSRFN